MQSLQLYVFGPKNSGSLVKGKLWFGSDNRHESSQFSPQGQLWLIGIIFLFLTNDHIIASILFLLILKNRFVELQVDKHSVGGFGGLIRRKKGAVAIRINYKGIRMEFISCHLSGKFSSQNIN
jgi:hypothetical protein